MSSILYLVAGKQFHDILSTRSTNNEITLPEWPLKACERLGLKIDTLYLDKHIKLGDINNHYLQQDRITPTPKEVLERISCYNTVIYLNGHLAPIQQLISDCRIHSISVRFIEFQHGWLVGKNTFHEYIVGGLPDVFVAWDLSSAFYARKKAQNKPVRVEILHDILALFQIEECTANNLKPAHDSINLLLCLSNRDFQLGYLQRDDCCDLNGRLVPSYAHKLFKRLTSYGNVTVEFRGKPHDTSTKISQKPLAEQISSADLVVSTISTVSIQSLRYYRKPSAWSFQHNTSITRQLLKSYPSIPHLINDTSIDSMISIWEKGLTSNTSLDPHEILNKELSKLPHIFGIPNSNH